MATTKGYKLSEQHILALKKAWIKRKEQGKGVAWNKGLRIRIKKTCIVCGKEFEIKPCIQNRRMHCSKKCYGISISIKKKGRSLPKRIKRKISQSLKGLQNNLGKKRTFESKRKQSAKMQHLSIEQWKGFKRSPGQLLRMKFRNSILKKVYERDNYTCQICGQRGGKLQVDHIQPWAEYVELRFCIDNCRTLCMSCHYQITFGKPMPPTVRVWGHNSKEGLQL